MEHCEHCYEAGRTRKATRRLAGVAVCEACYAGDPGSGELPLCACGCGQEVERSWQKFIPGHEKNMTDVIASAHAEVDAKRAESGLPPKFSTAASATGLEAGEAPPNADLERWRAAGMCGLPSTNAWFEPYCNRPLQESHRLHIFDRHIAMPDWYEYRVIVTGKERPNVERSDVWAPCARGDHGSCDGSTRYQAMQDGKAVIVNHVCSCEHHARRRGRKPKVEREGAVESAKLCGCGRPARHLGRCAWRRANVEGKREPQVAPPVHNDLCEKCLKQSHAGPCAIPDSDTVSAPPLPVARTVVLTPELADAIWRSLPTEEKARIMDVEGLWRDGFDDEMRMNAVANTLFVEPAKKVEVPDA